MNNIDDKFLFLFENMCCSRCKNDFDQNSVEIIREEPHLIVVHLTCQTCGKDFGISFLSTSNLDSDVNLLPLKKNERPTITSDDVLNAHEFIKNLDENWQQYLK